VDDPSLLFPPLPLKHVSTTKAKDGLLVHFRVEKKKIRPFLFFLTIEMKQVRWLSIRILMVESRCKKVNLL